MTSSDIYLELLKSHVNDNKYTKIYIDIVRSAIGRLPIDIASKSKRRVSRELLGYCEGHHIIPKCIFKTKYSDFDALVFLTAREHFICH